MSSLGPGSVDSTFKGGLSACACELARVPDDVLLEIEALENSPENITDPSLFNVYQSYLECAKIWCCVGLKVCLFTQILIRVALMQVS